MLQASVPNISSVFFRHMLQACLSGCHIFHTYVVSVSDSCFKCFICLFFILQVLHMDVSKVNRVLYMGCMWEARESTSGPCVDDIGWRSPRVGMGDAGAAE
jgi:hypothetical protein